MIAFENKTCTYDGQMHSATATNLPAGVTASYTIKQNGSAEQPGNCATDAGIYTITSEIYIPPASEYNKQSREAIVTSNSIGIGTCSIQYRQFKDADGKNIANAAVTVKEEETEITFDDLTEGEYYMDAVKWAVKNKVAGGVGDNNFAPTRDCTRGEIVTFLYRYFVQ